MSDLVYEWRAKDDSVLVRILNFEDKGPDTIRVEMDQAFVNDQSGAWRVTLNAEMVDRLCDVYALQPIVNTRREYNGPHGKRVAWTITCRLKYEVMTMIGEQKLWQEVPHVEQAPA